MKYSVDQKIDENEAKRFVKECDLQLEKQIEDAICFLEKERELTLFGLTGPTCSGKTTAARKITEHMEQNGHCVHVVSIDDFYFDMRYLKKRAELDPNIEIDYDSEETIDVSLLEEHVQNLRNHRPTVLPHFDFHTGTRTVGKSIRPQKGDVFLFEGIQILYPKVNAILNQTPNYCNLAISPLSSIAVEDILFAPNEIRFFRRLVRDYLHRSTDPSFTFYVWQSVRENEEKNIFPRMSLCHAQIDSTMPYEIGMLKPYLELLLNRIDEKSPYFHLSKNIQQKLQNVREISASYLTPKSLYKEFI